MLSSICLERNIRSDDSHVGIILKRTSRRAGDSRKFVHNLPDGACERIRLQKEKQCKLNVKPSSVL